MYIGKNVKLGKDYDLKSLLQLVNYSAKVKNMFDLGALMKYKISRHNTVNDVDEIIKFLMKEKNKDDNFFELHDKLLMDSYTGDEGSIRRKDMTSTILQRLYLSNNVEKELESDFPTALPEIIEKFAYSSFEANLSYYQPIPLVHDVSINVSAVAKKSKLYDVTFKNNAFIVSYNKEGGQFNLKEIEYLQLLALTNSISKDDKMCTFY